MTKEEKKELRKCFNLNKKLAISHADCSRRFDNLLIEHWKEHYSEKDIDPIIDTLDYGTSNITFEDFMEYMNEKCSPHKSCQNQK